MDTQKRSGEVMDAVCAINRCYSGSWNEEELRQYVHPDIVAVFPDTTGRIEGQDAYVAECHGFFSAAVIHDRRETDHRIQFYAGGKTAVVTYLYTITFALDNRKQDLQGVDMLVLVREGRRWRVVAQQFSSVPVES